MSVYAGAMQPNFAPAFSPFSQTPNVCFQCHTETCAVNDEHPDQRVLHWDLPTDERWDLPPIEMGVRCARENAGQSGAPTVAEARTLAEALHQAEEARVAAILALAQAEAEVEAVRTERIQPYLDRIESSVKAVRDAAALAGAATVRKDAKAKGAAA